MLTSAGGIVEIQATAAKATFDDAAFAALLGLARRGTAQLFAAQEEALLSNGKSLPAAGPEAPDPH